MIKVGITGGIGVGKSFIAKIFESIGISVYNADARSKWLIQNDESLITSVKENFGREVYNVGGTLNTKMLASIVFNNKQKLSLLNSIVHPAVKEDADNWFNAQQKLDKPYALKEAALIYETRSYLELNKVIVVSAPIELRINRTMLRDNCTRQEVLNRIEKQLPEQEKINLANYVILNDEKEMLLPQVAKIHKAICKLNAEITRISFNQPNSN